MSSFATIFKTRRDLWLSIAVTIIVVGSSFFLGWANDKTTTVSPLPGFHYIVEPHNILSYMANWDAVDYLSIARHGYTSLFWVNWFPVYPLAIHTLDYVSPSPLVSAFVISWLSLVGAIFFYIKIVRRLFKVTDVLEPLRALVFFVLFPTAVFLVAPFSESLFAFLALGAIYAALRKQWLWSAILAMVCSATHITGIFVVLLVGLILWEEKAKLSQVVATWAVGSLGLLAYMYYLLLDYHDPIAFLRSQTVYHDWVKHGFSNLITTATLTNVIFIVLIMVAAVYWWQRRRSFSIYSLLFLAIPLIGRQYGGFDRYVLMAFPIPLMIYGAVRDNKFIYPLATTLTGVAWTYILLQYAGGYIGS
jgi:Gpi18-like mannosyltransferase